MTCQTCERNERCVKLAASIARAEDVARRVRAGADGRTMLIELAVAAHVSGAA